ncbi:hypothetical protein NC651_039978 [Populus alba x Populus x berolinensis]|nr:hypothetical protein NC651_039978 [Populus alba x Populus x berolinensis]
MRSRKLYFSSQMKRPLVQMNIPPCYLKEVGKLLVDTSLLL